MFNAVTEVPEATLMFFFFSFGVLLGQYLLFCLPSRLSAFLYHLICCWFPPVHFSFKFLYSSILIGFFFFFMLSDTCVCFILFLNFVPCCTACGLFVPQPGLKPMCPKLEAQSLDRWTAREAPVCFNSLLTFSSASLLSFPEVSEQLNDCCFKLSWVNYLSQFL